MSPFFKKKHDRFLIVVLQFTIFPETFNNDPNQLQGAFIQGQRTASGAPWTDDSGNPLPYLPTVGNSGNPTYLKLSLYILDPAPSFAAIPEIGLGLFFPVLCEI